ncbi:hypothetical protein JB92DRAFT_3055521 [Gautieria morchelliformis]|nr:hypothetical protein JB92DRAFT_3055521 [Gautieria morchelliformis]
MWGQSQKRLGEAGIRTSVPWLGIGVTGSSARSSSGRKLGGRGGVHRAGAAGEESRSGGGPCRAAVPVMSHAPAGIHVTLSFVFSPPVVSGVGSNHKAPRKGTISPPLTLCLPTERLGVVVTASHQATLRIPFFAGVGGGFYFRGRTSPRSHNICNLPLVFHDAGRKIVRPTVCGCLPFSPIPASHALSLLAVFDIPCAPPLAQPAPPQWSLMWNVQDRDKDRLAAA